jgi:hypothetical protein
MALQSQLGKKVLHIRNAVDISKFLVLIPNFISNVEEEAIIQFLGPKLQRKRYESGHWDNVIHKYKETEILSDSMPEVVSKTVERFSNFIKETTGSSQMKFMSPHVLDLSSDGHIGTWYFLATSNRSLLCLPPSLQFAAKFCFYTLLGRLTPLFQI